jgi:hypothetical protein
MVTWRIYYDDYSTYSDLDGKWVDAPIHGVVCIVVRDFSKQWGRWVVSGYSPIKKGRGNLDVRYKTEFFVMYPDESQPYATNDLAPFRDKFCNSENFIKYGRECSQLNWQKIITLASNDPDFPKGTPRRRNTDR